MRFSDVTASVADKDRSGVMFSSDRGMIEFANKVMEAVARDLPKRLGISPVFCPMPGEGSGGIFRFGKGRDEMGFRYDYGSELHYLAALPLTSAVRWLLDNTSTRMDKYAGFLRDSGYGGAGDGLDEMLRNEAAIAFCAGLDDRWYRRPTMSREENIAASEKLCPSFGEHYERGRTIINRLLGRGVQSPDAGSRIRDYISFGIAMDFRPETTFMFMANIGRWPYPHSDTHNWLAEFPANASDTADSIAEKLLGVVQIEQLRPTEAAPTETESAGMRM